MEVIQILRTKHTVRYTQKKLKTGKPHYSSDSVFVAASVTWKVD